MPLQRFREQSPDGLGTGFGFVRLPLDPRI
jgi:hypothetical protein